MNKRVLKYIIFIAVIGLLAFIISHFFIQIAVIHGDSMKPTYSDGNIVFVKKQYNSISKGDIVIGKKNGIQFIKRVVGIEGDKLVIIDGILYVNDEMDKRYSNIKESGKLGDIVELGKDEYFLLGDNINNSTDSRSEEIGIVNKNDIFGIVIN